MDLVWASTQRGVCFVPPRLAKKKKENLQERK
jgi:hypothetical protein